MPSSPPLSGRCLFARQPKSSCRRSCRARARAEKLKRLYSKAFQVSGEDVAVEVVVVTWGTRQTSSLVGHMHCFITCGIVLYTIIHYMLYLTCYSLMCFTGRWTAHC